MKRIFLVRHAKPNNENADMQDFDKPLSARGEKDIPVAALELRQQHIKPDVIISSPAKRAITTAIILAEYLEFPKAQVVTDEEIYCANMKTLLELINQLDNKFETVFLVGHNPGMSEVAEHIVGDDIDLPTCGVYGIECEINDWQAVTMNIGREIFYDYPQKHPEN